MAHDIGRLLGLFIYSDVRNNMQASNESLHITLSLSTKRIPQQSSWQHWRVYLGVLQTCRALSGSNPYNELEGLSGLKASTVNRNGLDGSGFENRWGAKFSLSVQTDPKAHLAPSYNG